MGGVGHVLLYCWECAGLTCLKVWTLDFHECEPPTDVVSACLTSPAATPPLPRLQVDEYEKLCEYSEALEENWGKPPGNLNSNGQELLIYGKQFGNVFIGVQPTFGYEGDPMRLLFR